MQELSTHIYILGLIIYDVVSREFLLSHICTFTIIGGSGDVMLKDGSICNDFKPTIGNTQPWYIPGTYSILWSGKKLLKRFQWLIRSQPNSYLASRFMWLNWSSKYTTTLYVVIIGSSVCTLHVFNCLNIIYIYIHVT